MPPLHSINSWNPSNGSERIKLPPLPVEDINKLDQLLSFMKEHRTEPVNIYTFCKAKWGDNRLLYIFFAEYLRKNSFTSVQSYPVNGEYIWNQMIEPGGLALGSFKKEYVRQRKMKMANGEQAKLWYSWRVFLEIVLFPVAFINSGLRLLANMKNYGLQERLHTSKARSL